MTSPLFSVDFQDQIKPGFRIKKVSVKPGMARGRVAAYMNSRKSTKYIVQKKINLIGASLWVYKRGFWDMESLKDYLAHS
jgi:hypothetical protein